MKKLILLLTLLFTFITINAQSSDRLDPTMLDPFRNNPYTQSLASFA